MKRSDELVRIIKLNCQAIKSITSEISSCKRIIERAVTELKEITDGTKPDFEIKL